MKAIRLHASGGAEQLVYEEAPMPVLQAGDALFEGNIPPIPDSKDKRPGSDYVCGVCYNILATFEHVTPEEFRAAAQEIEDPNLKALLKT